MHQGRTLYYEPPVNQLLTVVSVALSLSPGVLASSTWRPPFLHPLVDPLVHGREPTISLLLDIGIHLQHGRVGSDYLESVGRGGQMDDRRLAVENQAALRNQVSPCRGVIHYHVAVENKPISFPLDAGLLGQVSLRS